MNMKNKLLTMALLTLTLTIGAQSAGAVTGTVAVTATTEGSVAMTFVTDVAGITLGASGTDAAAIAFGTVSAFGAAPPTGVTRTVNGTTSWSLSTPFDVVVQAANGPGEEGTYTLSAGLQTSDLVNDWTVGGTTLDTSPTVLTGTGAYVSTPYVLQLTIPFTATAGTITNTINFEAVAN